MKDFQDDLALNTARFKGYTPDARIVAHLRTRAKEFATQVPTFLNKKQPDKSAQPFKKKFRKYYLVNEENCEEESSAEDPSIDTSSEEYSQFYMGKGHPKGLGKGPKGKGKGKKGKPGKGGFRNQPHRHIAPQLNFDGPKGRERETLPQRQRKNFPIWKQRKRRIQHPSKE